MKDIENLKIQHMKDKTVLRVTGIGEKNFFAVEVAEDGSEGPEEKYGKGWIKMYRILELPGLGTVAAREGNSTSADFNPMAVKKSPIQDKKPKIEQAQAQESHDAVAKATPAEYAGTEEKGALKSGFSSALGFSEVVSIMVVLSFLALNLTTAILGAVSPEVHCKDEEAKNRMQIIAVSFTRTGKKAGCWLSEPIKKD